MIQSDHDADDLRDDPHGVDVPGDVAAREPVAAPRDEGAPELVEPAMAGGHGDWREDPAIAGDPELAAWLEQAGGDDAPADETGARLAQALSDDAGRRAPSIDELVRRTLSRRR